MAKIEPKSSITRGPAGRITEIIIWESVASGDECGWFDLAASQTGRLDSVQVGGKLGTDGACAIEGSNDGQVGHILHGGGGLEAVISGAPGIIGIMEPVRMVRPVFVGDGPITVTAYGRGV